LHNDCLFNHGKVGSLQKTQAPLFITPAFIRCNFFADF